MVRSCQKVISVAVYNHYKIASKQQGRIESIYDVNKVVGSILVKPSETIECSSNYRCYHSNEAGYIGDDVEK